MTHAKSDHQTANPEQQSYDEHIEVVHQSLHFPVIGSRVAIGLGGGR